MRSSPAPPRPAHPCTAARASHIAARPRPAAARTTRVEPSAAKTVSVGAAPSSTVRWRFSGEADERRGHETRRRRARPWRRRPRASTASSQPEEKERPCRRLVPRPPCVGAAPPRCRTEAGAAWSSSALRGDGDGRWWRGL
ncbi:hypothetical protein BS78_02G326800 [Paspalum vaginatum]|nr:hypothetical protein BS78_02G326800 [Paspalum vaginatum]